MCRVAVISVSFALEVEIKLAVSLPSRKVLVVYVAAEQLQLLSLVF